MCVLTVDSNLLENINMKLKHCTLIKAWADGALIQVLRNGEWVDVNRPQWCNRVEYRIKPCMSNRMLMTSWEISYAKA